MPDERDEDDLLDEKAAAMHKAIENGEPIDWNDNDRAFLKLAKNDDGEPSGVGEKDVPDDDDDDGDAADDDDLSGDDDDDTADDDNLLGDDDDDAAADNDLSGDDDDDDGADADSEVSDEDREALEDYIPPDITTNRTSL